MHLVAGELEAAQAHLAFLFFPSTPSALASKEQPCTERALMLPTGRAQTYNAETVHAIAAERAGGRSSSDPSSIYMFPCLVSGSKGQPSMRCSSWGSGALHVQRPRRNVLHFSKLKLRIRTRIRPARLHRPGLDVAVLT